MKTTRILALGVLAGAAVAANAQSFFAASLGTYDNSFGPYYTTAESVISYVDAYSAPLTLDFLADYGGSGIVSGTAVYTSAGGTLTLALTGGGPFYYDGAANVSSVAGSWTFVSGTGDYADIASGSGTFSASYSASLGALAQTTFVGEFTPVPEPATMAVLAAGALALARRRRKA